jgi:hypothetical protein
MDICAIISHADAFLLPAFGWADALSGVQRMVSKGNVPLLSGGTSGTLCVLLAARALLTRGLGHLCVCDKGGGGSL